MNHEAIIKPDDLKQSIVTRFERISALYPSRTALGSGAWQPTYAELNALANRLAHALLSHSGAPADRVAVLMRHDSPLFAAVLGVLKAGRIVVTLNPTDPPIRLAQVLKEAEPGLMVTDSSNNALAEQIAPHECKVIRLEEHSTGPVHNPQILIAPDQTAFLIYTSGSTGRPKGVMRTHRNTLHNVLQLTRGMDLRDQDRIILLAALSGGQGTATTWCALLNSAALCPFPIMEKGVTGLADWMIDHRITVYVSAASVFRHFMRTIDDQTLFPAVRIVRLGSEPATPNDFANYRKHFADGSVLIHTLSSSETGNITQCRLTHIDHIADGPLPLGEPVDGVEILLLDEQGREVSTGETGEIAVRSRHLSPGYWRNESLTLERFSGGAGPNNLRVFRSGDLGRRTADGLFTFMGRKDARVKIHGYRIEISEIEDLLTRAPEVEKAVVCVRQTRNDDSQLAAYVVLRAGQKSTAEKLRNILRASLPRHMVPASFVFLESFPLTAHGKIDREKLRQINPPAPEPTEKPVTESEILLAKIWSEIFGRDLIGRHDHFFDLGGDSLSAAVTAAKVHSVLQVALDLRVFTDHPTLADLAGVIDSLRDSDQVENLPRLSRASRDTHLPLSFVQERTLKYSQTTEASAGYIRGTVHHLHGSLNVDILRESMNYIVQRHEILRTTFDNIDGKTVQIIHPPEPVLLPLFDLTGMPDAENQTLELFRKESRLGFDLARGPLLRFLLVRIREDEHRLLRINHIIISDGWSWTVYFHELGLIYEAKLRGETSPLPEFEPLQYGDYAAWERRVLDTAGEVYRQKVQWWKNLFSGKPRPTAPPFKRRKPLQNADSSEGFIQWGLDASISERLEQLGREQGATYYVVRLAAFVALMANETKKSDVIIGTYVSNRRHVESQKMFGFFVNLVTLRLHCNQTQTFLEWARVVRKMVGQVHTHSDIPYEQLCEELRNQGVHPPEISAIFGVSQQTAPIRFGGLVLTRQDRRTESMPWGFSTAVDQFNEGHRCRTTFDARIYDPVRVHAFIERYKRLLDTLSHNPNLPVAELLRISKTSATPKGSGGIFTKIPGMQIFKKSGNVGSVS
jgi:amino acid adenylation domain-containing protein